MMSMRVALRYNVLAFWRTPIDAVLLFLPKVEKVDETSLNLHPTPSS